MEFHTSIFDFVKELADFSFELSVLDRVWNILFPDEREKWQHLHINRYQHTFYITHINGDGGSLEVEPKKVLRAMAPMGAFSPRWTEDRDQLDKTWTPLIKSARKWMKVIRKDWIKANKRIQLEYP
ncbi:MAG: hypothetical protein U5R49_14100 [Deltaproteobacteria bacterium]|nr:hypothetical protein [Deltaproteobacteria bacterium]